MMIKFSTSPRARAIGTTVDDTLDVYFKLAITVPLYELTVLV
jgi:hypothetical protein